MWELPIEMDMEPLSWAQSIEKQGNQNGCHIKALTLRQSTLTHDYRGHNITKRSGIYHWPYHGAAPIIPARSVRQLA